MFELFNKKNMKIANMCGSVQYVVIDYSLISIKNDGVMIDDSHRPFYKEAILMRHSREAQQQII